MSAAEARQYGPPLRISTASEGCFCESSRRQDQKKEDMGGDRRDPKAEHANCAPVNRNTITFKSCAWGIRASYTERRSGDKHRADDRDRAMPKNFRLTDPEAPKG